jgi:hypothetical protein
MLAASEVENVVVVDGEGAFFIIIIHWAGSSGRFRPQPVVAAASGGGCRRCHYKAIIHKSGIKDCERIHTFFLIVMYSFFVLCIKF